MKTFLIIPAYRPDDRLPALALALRNAGFENIIAVGTDTEVDQSRSSNPRTAIGMIEPGHYVMVVSDGRTSESEGLTLYELAEIMQELGCTEAYNLDGGGSSTMYYNGEVINNPTSGRNKIKERSVSDIVYIAV